jgi:hypothetical protein
LKLKLIGWCLNYNNTTNYIDIMDSNHFHYQPVENPNLIHLNFSNFFHQSVENPNLIHFTFVHNFPPIMTPRELFTRSFVPIKNPRVSAARFGA